MTLNPLLVEDYLQGFIKESPIDSFDQNFSRFCGLASFKKYILRCEHEHYK